MNVSIKNGAIAGVVGLIIFWLPRFVTISPNIPIGVVSIAAVMLCMWNTAKHFIDKETFREHVREPFITFLVANVIIWLGRLVSPMSAGSIFNKDMAVMFPFGLIIGFILAGIITFVIRKIQ